MKTCGTCRHWKPIVSDPDDLNEDRKHPPGCGTCQAIQHPEGFRETESDGDWEGLRRRKNAAKKQSKSYVEDGSGYYAALICKTDFGCVLHEGKT